LLFEDYFVSEHSVKSGRRNGGIMIEHRKDFKKSVLRTASIFLIALLSSSLYFLHGQKQDKNHPYLEIAGKILEKGLREEKAFPLLEKLTSIGPRLTGSAQAASAVELMRQEMQALGLVKVHLEPTRVERWVRGKTEKAKIISSIGGTTPLSICALGGSIPTPEKGITAQVLEVKSFEELNKLKEKAKGKIIFFNRTMDRALIDSFQAYGQAAEQRVRGAAQAARAGGVAALVRSLTLRDDDFPHTGLMNYEPSVRPIPAASVSTKGANLLSELLRKDPSLNIQLKLDCRELSPVESNNVVGQISGSEKPDEIILLGGHLDSWDLGSGAHDDGAGCVQSIEALRLIKELGIKPKRTIRAVMFMNEEFGGSGGRDYARSQARKEEIHLAAIESDRGGFSPLGFGIGGSSQAVKSLQRWEYLFELLGTFWLKEGGGGVDIAPLAQEGTILISLVPESHKYFDFHHSAKDVLDAVHPRELELGAIAMAIFAYVMAQEGV